MASELMNRLSLQQMADYIGGYEEWKQGILFEQACYVAPRARHSGYFQKA